MRLFNQSCRVCHTKPQMTSPLYGPELSQSSAGGQEAGVRGGISKGTPPLPGLQNHFWPPPNQTGLVDPKKKTPPPPPPGPAARAGGAPGGENANHSTA